MGGTSGRARQPSPRLGIQGHICATYLLALQVDGVSETYSGYVDRCDFGQAEVPEQARVDEGRNKTAGCGVDVDVDINVAFNEEVVDSLDVFVFTSVCCAEDGTWLCQYIPNLPKGNFRLKGDIQMPIVFSSHRSTHSLGSMTYRSVVQ